MHAAFAPNGKWIAVDEDGWSGPSDVYLLDRTSGETLRIYAGATDYAALSFSKGSAQLFGQSLAFDDKGEWTTRLTWPVRGGKPSVRRTRKATLPPGQGEFPVSSPDRRFEIRRDPSKMALYLVTRGSKRLLCRSDKPYRLGAFVGKRLAAVADDQSVYVIWISDRRELARLTSSRNDDDSVTWKGRLSNGKGATLNQCLAALRRHL
ncbi:MAG: hypothetical protein ACR2HJ_09290 [Fimbriimonadales bacterium]